MVASGKLPGVTGLLLKPSWRASAGTSFPEIDCGAAAALDKLPGMAGLLLKAAWGALGATSFSALDSWAVAASDRLPDVESGLIMGLVPLRP